MKTIEKVIYKADRVWYEVAEKRIVGDMYFTFQESDDSRTTDINSLIINVRDGIGYELRDEVYHINDKESVPIYRIVKAKAYLELEDDEDEAEYENDLLMFDIDEYWELVYSIAVCSKEYADEIGLTEGDEFYDKKPTK